MIPVEDLLRLVLDEGGSDLHITVGAPPTLRLNGQVTKLQVPSLTAAETEELVRAVTKDEQLKRVYEQGGTDFALAFREDARFRVSMFLQKGSLGMVCRLLPKKILTPREIGLPPALDSLIELPRGLILVTGPTGSGKTTTLASLLNVLNEGSRKHIITLEDPIEYFHEHKKGLINQREIGVDVPTFAEGLKRALRQDPDVILVGEMRDLETMEAAVTAAETGHLVFSTLHTTGAARTIDRIIDAFPTGAKEQIRTQLAGNLRAVLSQILLARADGRGRVAAFELLVNTSSVATLIRENKTHRLAGDIQTGTKYGMVSLEASLVELCARGTITRESVLAKAQDPQVATQLLQDVQQ
ncbi:MAG: type IV pilus twitching motility protein PilT [Verrucomicrobia bacterium]|nr:type IV pilus twitching motility protein PilT [Verrucomicrobiota bacterium]